MVISFPGKFSEDQLLETKTDSIEALGDFQN